MFPPYLTNSESYISNFPPDIPTWLSDDQLGSTSQKLNPVSPTHVELPIPTSLRATTQSVEAETSEHHGRILPLLPHFHCMKVSKSITRISLEHIRLFVHSLFQLADIYEHILYPGYCSSVCEYSSKPKRVLHLQGRERQ